MNQIKVAICDSDQNICVDIKNLIQKIDSTILTKIFNSKFDLLNAEEKFSIYLLDIKGVNGLQIAKNLRENQSESVIIFLTGYRDFMEEAFDVNAFHYLIKPIDIDRFTKIFLRAVKEVMKNFDDREILLKVGEFNYIIKLRDIFFVESSNKKIIFHTTSGIYEVYGTMDAIQNILGKNFYRCHRCYLVNLSKIVAYNSQSIKLINGDNLILAQKKYSEFVKTYLNNAKSE